MWRQIKGNEKASHNKCSGMFEKVIDNVGTAVHCSLQTCNIEGKELKEYIQHIVVFYLVSCVTRHWYNELCLTIL